MYKKILIVFGTRPEAIKLAPIVAELKNHPHFDVFLINTGQHQEILDQMIQVFDLEVKEHLGSLKKGGQLSSQTSSLLQKTSECYQRLKPDVVIVQGDTSTAFAAGMAAFYHHIPLVHVEAGLRTYDRVQPFPEEFNRHMLSYITDWHFAPCTRDADNLEKEGCPKENIFIVGNTVIDSLLHIIHSKKARSLISPDVREIIHQSNTKKLVLITCHRRENFGKPMENIYKGIFKLAKKNKDAQFIFSIHPNTNIKNLETAGIADLENVILHPPFNYIDFAFLMRSAYCILCDSGGIQEEAPIFGKPVLVLREKTERTLGIEKGIAKLIGTSSENIFFETDRLLQDKDAYQNMVNTEAKYLYGDGNSAKKIVTILANIFAAAGSHNKQITATDPITKAA